MTRRQALALPLLSRSLGDTLAGAQTAEGVATRSVKPLPRGKPSGLPFHAHFTKVTQAAGLRPPVVDGGIDRKTYIIETMGCGAALFDYDNDGWLDILLLTGRRLKATPDDAVIRLYRNNRDGTFSDVTAHSGLGRS